MTADLGTRVTRGLAWIGLATAVVGVLDVVALVLLLSLWLSPEQYGIAVLATSLFPLLDVVTDLGLSGAVIQRSDHSQEQLSTLFWVNLGLSSVFVLVLLVASPALGRFYGHPVVGAMLSAYALKLVLQNAYLIPQALLKRELRFKEASIIRLVANLSEFTCKIAFAAAGAGIWCFVAGRIVYVLAIGIGTQVCRPWWPSWVVRPRATWDLIQFGLKMSASQFLFNFYTNVDYPIVNYYFGPAATGLYRYAYELVLEVVRLASLMTSDIAFPTFARVRTYPAQMIAQLIWFSRLNLVIVLPWLALVTLLAEDLISLCWGAQWRPAATAARILCLVGLLRALSFVLPPMLDGAGKPHVTLVYNVVAAVVLPLLFIVGAVVLGPHLGYVSVAVAWAVGYPVAFGVLAWLAVDIVGLSIGTYLRRLVGVPACVGAAMVIAAAARAVMAGTGPGWRVAGVATVFLAALGPLLSYTQGMGPRTIWAAVRGAKVS